MDREEMVRMNELISFSFERLLRFRRIQNEEEEKWNIIGPPSFIL